MGFGKESEEKRKRAMKAREAAEEKQKQLEELRRGQAEYDFAQKEQKAFEAGESRKGFLGTGSYSGSSVDKEAAKLAPMHAKLDASKDGLKLALDSKKLMGKAGQVEAAAGLAEKAGIIDTDSEAGGAAMGVASGAAMGAKLGPWGAAIGGAIGGISGAIGAGEKRKQKLAQIEANKQKALGDIAERKAQRLQSAFSNLGASLSGLF